MKKETTIFCPKMVVSFCVRTMKKFFRQSAYEFELLHKSRQSRVYHQDEVLHITNSEGIVYHHCECGIQPTADDIHASRDDIRLTAKIYQCFRNR